MTEGRATYRKMAVLATAAPTKDINKMLMFLGPSEQKSRIIVLAYNGVDVAYTLNKQNVLLN